MISRLGSSTTRALLKKRVLTNSSYHASQYFHSTPQRSAVEPAPGIRRRKHELPPESKEKVEAIFQKILWLDMIEVHLLTELINKKMGIILTDKERAALQKEVNRQLDEEMGATTASDEKAEEEETGPKVVELKLTGFDAKSKIKVIKEVRAIAELGLKEAKELVEGAPKIVAKDLKPETAEELKERLEAVGAQVEIV